MTAPPSRERIALSVDLAEVARMNRWFDALAERETLPPGLASDVKLCLNEAVTNALSYGFDSAAETDAVVVDLRIAPDRVTAVIGDTGRPFDPRVVADPTPAADMASAEIGGLGIKLIREMSSAMDYARTDGWNLLTLRFDRAGG